MTVKVSTAFANQQPAGFKNHVENIVIVGAGGRSGQVMVKEIVKGGKHRVTAVTRPDSENTMPAGLHKIEKVNYSDHSELVRVFTGQDVLIITMGVMAPKESQTQLIDAAVEAGVRWIMPNEWGTDHANIQAGKDVLLGERILAIHDYIEKVGAGKTYWISVCCGFWYEFSLAGTEARYGFDFGKKEVTFYDDGETKMNTTTWPQLGRGVANLLSLKILPDNENDKRPYLSLFNNGSAYISSFFVNQKDMFDSVLRVTGDKKSDWKISHEDVQERYARGMKMMKEGQMVGFGILLYARMFYKDAPADFNDKVNNDTLGLPREDFDEATSVAVQMAKDGDTNAIHMGDRPSNRKV